MLDDGDVIGFLVCDQPVQVRTHGMEGIGGHHGARQLRLPKQLGEVAGLAVLSCGCLHWADGLYWVVLQGSAKWLEHTPQATEAQPVLLPAEPHILCPQAVTAI